MFHSALLVVLVFSMQASASHRSKEMTAGSSSDDKRAKKPSSPTFTTHQELVCFCRISVQSTARASLWKKMIGYDDPGKTPKQEIQQREKCYRRLLYRSCSLDGDNNVAARSPPSVIDLDVARTQTGCAFYSGGKDYSSHSSSVFSAQQQALRRILHTSCAPGDGLVPAYVQGMNEIAAMLLYVFCGGNASDVSEKAEADAFWCFCALVRHLNFERIGKDEVGEFRKTLKSASKGLYKHIESVDSLLLTSHATRWLMTLFTQDFSLEATLPIWDLLLSFGKNLMGAAIYVAVAIIVNKRDVLFSATSVETLSPLIKSTDDSVEAIVEGAKKLLGLRL